MATLKELEMQMKGIDTPRVKYPNKIKTLSTVFRIAFVLQLILAVCIAFTSDILTGFIFCVTAIIYYIAADAIKEHADNQYKIMSDLDQLITNMKGEEE